MRKACCQDEKNLGAEVQVNENITYRRCQICQCRHFELSVEPGSLGIVGASL